LDKADRKSEFEQEAWVILREHRRRAATFPLNILVWGPSDDGTREYKARCMIRDELKKRGHNAEFSEVLCKAKDAIPDAMHDEFLQALSADAIIMIYGSRGTQTERDTILVYPDVACKTFLLVEESVWSNIQNTMVSKSWEKMAGLATVIRYESPELLESKVDLICNQMQEMRKECYVKRLQSRGVF